MSDSRKGGRSVLGRAWPDGVPASEQALWDTLGEQARETVDLRIRALVSYESQGNAARRWREAGMTRPGFFDLLRRWRSDRSIASLVPRVRGQKTSNPAAAISEEEAAAITRLIAADPAMQVPVVVDAVKSELGEASDDDVLRRAVRRIRIDAVVDRVVARMPDASKNRQVEEVRRVLADGTATSTLRTVVEAKRAAHDDRAVDREDGFGRRILIASLPAVRRSSRTTDGRPWAHTALVVDVATRTVLGGGAAARAADAMAMAARDAADHLEAVVMETEGSEAPVFEIHVPTDADAVEMLKARRRVGDGVVWEEADEASARVIGTRLIEVVGRRFGTLDLRPRGVADEDDPKPEVVGGLLADHLRRERAERPPVGRSAVALDTLVSGLRAFAG